MKYISDEELRRTIQEATNKNESFNGFTKWLSFGGEGIIGENDRERQRKFIKYNHLISNCLIFYNVFALTRILRFQRATIPILQIRKIVRLIKVAPKRTNRCHTPTILYGKKGELHQPHREGQQEQLNALGLVTNAIILWNTVYIEAALGAIRKAGCVVNLSDVKRFSPLGYDHINIVGHYSFNLPEEVLLGKLRPLQPMNSKLFGNK